MQHEKNSVENSKNVVENVTKNFVSVNIVFPGDKDCDMTMTMRSVLVDWLFEVAEEYNASTATFHNSISLLDRLIGIKQISRYNFQGYGLACLWVSMSFFEVNVPDMYEMKYISADIYSIERIKEIVIDVLHTLGNNILCHTVYNEFLSQGGEGLGRTCKSPKVFCAIRKFLLGWAVMYYEYNSFSVVQLAKAALEMCIFLDTSGFFEDFDSTKVNAEKFKKLVKKNKASRFLYKVWRKAYGKNNKYKVINEYLKDKTSAKPPRSNTNLRIPKVKCRGSFDKLRESLLSTIPRTMLVPPQKFMSSLSSRTIVRKLGEGTFGKVYLVTTGGGTKTGCDIENKENQALKRSPSKRDCIFWESSIQSYIREITVMNILEHKNIIELLEFEYVENGVNLLLPFVEHTLEKYLEVINKMENKNDMLAKKAGLIHQLFSAVSYMHSKGFMHRDITFRNIMVTSDETLKLIDFGMCNKIADRMRNVYTGIVCSLFYRAPEVLYTEGGYGKDIDVWSCGAVAYYILFGKGPFDSALSEEEYSTGILKKIGVPETENIKKWYIPNRKKYTGKEGFPELESFPEFKDLITGCLVFDPAERLTAEKANEMASNIIKSFDGTKGA